MKHFVQIPQTKGLELDLNSGSLVWESVLLSHVLHPSHIPKTFLTPVFLFNKEMSMDRASIAQMSYSIITMCVLFNVLCPVYKYGNLGSHKCQESELGG